MIKNNKGITLTILAVTIIIIIIIAGITIKMSDYFIKDTKNKSQITNMQLIKGKIETIYEDYEFNKNEVLLKGTPKAYQSLQEYGINSNSDINNYWYELNKTNLVNDLGFDKRMFLDNETYIVNYKTAEVINPNGVEDSLGNLKYKLSDMLNDD